MLTNKQTSRDIPHLMGHWDHVNQATSSKYALECRRMIKDIFKRGKTPIIEGGSGFYIHSVFNPRLLTPQEGFEEVKQEAQKVLEDNFYSHTPIRELDPDNLLGISEQFSEYKLINSLAIAMMAK